MAITKKTAISLPDELFRQIERARKRSRLDRSTWIQQAATEYLKKRTTEEEIEAWLSAEERFPPSEDEISLRNWVESHWSELLSDEPVPKIPRKVRRR